MRTGRRRAITTLGMVLGLALLAGLVAAVVGRPSSPAGPVYTVAQVRAGLARQPAAWAGRTLLVRGIAAQTLWATGPTNGIGQSCYRPFPPSSGPGSCPLVAPHGATVYLWLIDDSSQSLRSHLSQPLFLAQPSDTTILGLVVQPVTPNPLLALARRVPPLARFLPIQGQVPGGVPHLYRIRLQSIGSTSCLPPFWFMCAAGVLAGVLVDAHP